MTFGNPFYLNPNENLSQSIVNIILDGANYQIWSRYVKFTLKTKHKLGFIDGSIKPPDSVRRSVINYENAQALWEELKSRFGYANAVKLANLQDEIHACKQGTMSVTQYFTIVKGLWEEYSQFSPIVHCNCAPGNQVICPAVAAFQEKQDTDYLIRFLRGLGPEYDVVKTQLLMMKPLPSINQAFNHALQHEDKIKGKVTTQGEQWQSLVFAATTNPPTSNAAANAVSFAKPATSNTKFKGKVTTQGEQWQSPVFAATTNPPTSNAAANAVSFAKPATSDTKFCRYCKKDTHVIEDCLKLKVKKKREELEKKQGSPGANPSFNRFAGMVVQGGDESHHSKDDSSAANICALSNEELHQLRSLLQSSSPHRALAVSQGPPTLSTHSGKYVLTSNMHSDLAFVWIIDTGASDHICCTLDHFIDPKPVIGVSVHLPNSTKVSVSHIGSVKLPIGLILQNVLLVPSFGFNLVSVSKLTHDLPVSFVF
ncbi:hypothetical protein LINPERHAP1_LOCUS40246 [Linum perenne]